MKPQQLESGNVVKIPLNTFGNILLECCDCGLNHEIIFTRNDDDEVSMKFIRINELDVEKYNFKKLEIVR